MIPNLHKMIQRQAQKKLLALAKVFKAVAVIGPRQSGKTTLTKISFPEKPYLSLENPDIRQFATEDPKGFLAQYKDGAILDEIQRTPHLLSYLQQILDESNEKGKFILSGSNNFLLQEKITQSLAGRAAYMDLLPLSVGELKTLGNWPPVLTSALFQGGYPAIHAEGIPANDFFTAYIRTYVERDVRQIKNIGNLLLFERLLALCASRVGQQINFSGLSNELGIDVKTVQAWLGILQASYILFLLPPYFKNFKKRIVKSPKLYFYDTGLAINLLRIKEKELFNHPIKGALFENFIITELLKNRFNQGERSNLYYWRDRSGNEMDILIDEGLNLTPVEIKSSATIQSSFFKNFKFWEKLTGHQGGIVFYNGATQQVRSNNILIEDWKMIDQY